MKALFFKIAIFSLIPLLVPVSGIIFPQTGDTYDRDHGVVQFPNLHPIGNINPRSRAQKTAPCVVPIAPDWFFGSKHTISWDALAREGPGGLQIRYREGIYDVIDIVFTDGPFGGHDLILLQISGNVPDYVPLYKHQVFAGTPLTIFSRGPVGTTPIRASDKSVIGWQTANLDGLLRQGVGVANDPYEGGWDHSIRWDFTTNSCWADVGDSGGPVFVGESLAGAIWSNDYGDDYALECGGTPISQRNHFTTNGVISWWRDATGQPVCVPYNGRPSSSIASAVYYHLDWIYSYIAPPQRISAGSAPPGWSSWNGSRWATSQFIDTSNVLQPAPLSVYQSMKYLLFQPESKLEYRVQNLLANETYKVRLHFSNFLPFGSFNEDIYINGALARANFDPASVPYNKASILELPGVHPENNSILISVRPQNPNGFASISGIEVVRDAQTTVNLLSTAEGGRLQSFTGQFDSGAWSVSKLTDGVKGGVGHAWASPLNPGGPHEFIYNFANQQIARLSSVAFRNFSESGTSEFAREVEFYGSMDALSWTLLATGILPQAEASEVFELNGVDARHVRIVVKNGYSSAQWKLGEVEVFGSINHAPLAHSRSATFLEDTPGQITLTAADEDGNPLAYSLMSHPAKGQISGAPPHLLYTPEANAQGPDSFTFIVDDGTVQSSVAIVRIVTLPVNDPPTLAPIRDWDVLAGSGAHQVELTGISSGPADEKQTLQFAASAEDPSLIGDLAVDYAGSGSVATLKFSTVGSGIGVTTVTVTVKDDGGEQNGGTDRISRQFTVTIRPQPLPDE